MLTCLVLGCIKYVHGKIKARKIAAMKAQEDPSI